MIDCPCSNNAGVFIGQSFLDTTVEAWDKVMNVNVRAGFVVCFGSPDHIFRIA